MVKIDFQAKETPDEVVDYLKNKGLKLTFNYCNEHGLLDKRIEELKKMELPFRIDLLPINFPSPNELTLNMKMNKNAL